MANRKLMFLAVLVLAGSICGVAQDQQSGSKPTEPVAVPADYVIGAQDVLNINVWKEPEVSATVPVRTDGKISLALLNDVQAAGLTPMQLTASLTEKLRKYLSEPRVTVTVTQMNSQRIFFIGQVRRPGAMPLPANTTALQAIAAAGGLTEEASGKKIQIMRNENGKQVKYPFNYNEVIKGNKAEQNIMLKPGDTIIVP